jgi:crotonobetainyl-CoA:carnitine CoA-transferase CaiB-like acyl-CoA transferase
VQSPDGAFHGAPPLNPERTGFHPSEALYQTRDAWVAIAARSDAMAAALAAVLNINLPGRTRWGEPEAALIAAAMRVRSSATMVAELQTAGVWVEVCEEEGWQSLRASDAARACGLIVEGHDDAYGRVSAVGPLVHLSRSSTAPCLGSVAAVGHDTRSILSELGYSQASVDQLYADNVVA